MKRVFAVVALVAAMLTGGYFAAGAASTPHPAVVSNNGGLGENYHGLTTPARLYDSRTHDGPLGDHSSRTITVAGNAGVPANATGVLLNVTVADTTQASYLSVVPDGADATQTSTVNWSAPGTLLSNEVSVALPADGKVAVYNLNGTTTVVLDVFGYYTDDVPQVFPTVSSTTALNNGDTTLTNVGGKIATLYTPLTGKLHLDAGTYTYTLYGDFHRQAGTGADNPAGNQTYGTVFIWTDTNNDGVYDWQNGEGVGQTVQTPAVPIDAATTSSIEQSGSGTGVITVPANGEDVQVGGFAYNTNSGSYGTAGQVGGGDFHFLGATASFVKIS